jgi:hypothetical protein
MPSNCGISSATRSGPKRSGRRATKPHISHIVPVGRTLPKIPFIVTARYILTLADEEIQTLSGDESELGFILNWGTRFTQPSNGRAGRQEGEVLSLLNREMRLGNGAETIQITASELNHETRIARCARCSQIATI